MKSKPTPNIFVLLTLVLVINTVAGCIPFTPTPLPTATPTEVPEQINGVTVHYYFDWVRVFRADWLDENNRCLGVQLDSAAAPPVGPVIQEFTSAYDFNFLNSHLKDIYLLKELNCRGASMGGSYDNSAVFLAVRPNDPTEVLLSILHAEFSSILMLNHRSAFPEQEWHEINPNGFVYSDDPYQFIQTPTIRDTTEQLSEDGFLTGYNKASMEDDFNMFVEWLFVRGDELCEQRSQYVRIDKKAELAVKFYADIGAGVKFSTCN